MKRILSVCLALVSSAAFAAGKPDLTEGVWYVSILEKDGELKPSMSGIRFKPDGSAEIVLSEEARKQEEKFRRDFKRKNGKELPRLSLRWEWDGKVLKLHTSIPQKDFRRTEVYLAGDDPAVLMPQKPTFPAMLARKGAKLSAELARKFMELVREATRDRFADDLKLPENVPLAEPEKALCNIHFFTRSHWRDAPAGSFQQAVLSAIGKGPQLADDAKCRIPALEKLLAAPETREILLHYFACHPEWRLYRERRGGGLHAVRYFRYPEGEIAASLNQFYAHFLPSGPSGKKVGDPALEFQFRFDIGLDGVAWNSSPRFPRNATEHRGNDWNTRFFCGKALVDIVDQSRFPGRQMTAAALEWSEKEFARLAAAPEKWRELLPPGSVRRGEPDLILRNSFQGGIYEAAVWCNPGEKGTICLKAFEITKGTPLSAQRLKTASGCIAGWSADPREQFCSAMHFTIYEGEWEQFYGARFEVWFQPESGGAERKLFEKNYKIQGWQR